MHSFLIHRPVHVLLLVAAWLLSPATFAQESVKDWNYQPIPFNITTNNNFLTDNEIIGSAVDSHGLIWLITSFGIMTFDGQRYSLHPDFQNDEIKYYTLNGRRIISDLYDRIWLLTDDRGVLMYDKQSTDFSLFNKHENAHVRLINDRVHDIHIESKDILWITTDDFIIQKINLETGEINNFDAAKALNKLFPDVLTGRFGQILAEDEFLWIGCQWGIVKFNRSNHSMRFIPFLKEVQYNDPPSFNMALYKNKNEIYIAPQFAAFHGIAILNTITEKITRHEEAPSQSTHEDIFCSFTRWSENILIAGARRQGYMLIDLENHTMERIYGHTFGMPNLTIQEVYQVHRVNESLAYFIAYEQIIKVSKSKNPFHFYYLDVDDGQKHNWQASFLENPNGSGFFLGTGFGDGILPIDMSGNKINPIRYISKSGQYDYDVTFNDILQGPDGVIWLGTSAGLLTLDLKNKRILPPKSKSIMSSSMANNSIHELYYNEPLLYISTHLNGLFQYNTNADKIRHISFQSHAQNHTSDRIVVNDFIPINDSTLWITSSEGLYQLQAGENQLYKIPQLSNHELNHIALKYTLLHNNHLYIASSGNGLYDIELSGETIANIHKYINEENILYNKLCKIIPHERTNSLWLNTGDGFSEFNISENKFTNYSIPEGISFRRRDGKNFYQTSDGTIIAGAYKHFQYFHPDSVSISPLTTSPYLHSFSSLNQYYPIRSFTSDTMLLPKGNNTLEIGMRAINHNSNSLNYYSYRLVGYDDDWTPPTQDATARYTKIPGGNYSFHYRVANKNFDWTLGAPLFIQIAKKTTERSIFWILIALVSLIFLYAIYRWQLSQQAAKADLEREYSMKINELEMDALRLQMNPHFIFNSINSINWFIIKNDRDNASNYLTKFSRLIRLSLENSKSKLIPLTNEIEAITIYLAMEKLRFESRFDFDIKIESHINTSAILIPPMIIQPYVENAIWHGIMNKKGNGSITLSINLQDNKLRCVIEDDGIGREASKQISNKKLVRKESLGMKITADRLRFIEETHKIETKTEIIDLHNEAGSPIGTRVIIEIPRIHVKN